jgi:hypothetical protein
VGGVVAYSFLGCTRTPSHRIARSHAHYTHVPKRKRAC